LRFADPTALDRIDADNVGDMLHAIARQQLRKAACNPAHDAGSLINQRGEQLHQRGPEADFGVGIRSRGHAAGADHNVALAIHSPKSFADAEIGQRRRRRAGHRAGHLAPDMLGRAHALGLDRRQNEHEAGDEIATIRCCEHAFDRLNAAERRYFQKYRLPQLRFAKCCEAGVDMAGVGEKIAAVHGVRHDRFSIR